MLRSRSYLFRILTVAIALKLGAVAAVAQTVMKFAAEDKELYPTYLGDGVETLAEKPGVTVELIRLTAADLGITPTFIRAPWRRCLDLLKGGEVDAAINASFNSERLEYGEYPLKDGKPDESKKSHVWTYTLYRKKGSHISWNGKGFESLDGALGTPLGYSIAGDLKKMNLDVDESGDAEANLRKLSAGRISGAVLLREATDPLVKAKGFTDIEAEAPVEAKPTYIMLSHQLVKRDPALAEEFWAHFAEVRAAKLGEVSNKY